MNKSNQSEIKGFKIKLKNLRKENFPEEMTQTDYFGYRVGDILRKGRSGTIYKVVSIYRGLLTNSNYDYYLKEGLKVTKNDPFFVKIMEKYKESSNFGRCFYRIEPIMKSYQPIKAKRTMTICELSEILRPYLKRYHRFDITSAVKIQDIRIVRNKARMNTLANALVAEENRKAALQHLYSQHCVPTVVTEAGISNENPH